MECNFCELAVNDTYIAKKIYRKDPWIDKIFWWSFTVMTKWPFVHWLTWETRNLFGYWPVHYGNRVDNKWGNTYKSLRRLVIFWGRSAFKMVWTVFFFSKTFLIWFKCFFSSWSNDFLSILISPLLTKCKNLISVSNLESEAEVKIRLRLGSGPIHKLCITKMLRIDYDYLV